MDIRPIRNKADHRAALKAVARYFDEEPPVDSDDADRFEILLTLIQAYEAKHHPVLPPDPVEAIKFRMEQQGLSVKDLEPMIGRSNRVYEVLNHRRSLTLPMIWKLHRGLGIPAEVLIQPPAGA
ncbi:MAG: transcriptional regulator [Burkholderiaceae bacterium]|nr:transcriptional regulator [Burkholderiaceae bacterium]